MAEVLKLLLVEDNPDDEQLSLRVLRQFHGRVTVEVARDGEQALDRLLDVEAPIPDLVLLDLRLPKIGGPEIARQIRQEERTSGIPVIVLRSTEEPADFRASYESYISGAMLKPITAKGLKEVVAALGLDWPAAE